MTDPAFYQLWHLTFRKFRDDLAISGSPNRTLRRLLFEDISGRIYLLEEYDIRKKAAQSAQNRILEFFRDQHLSGITPALQADRGEPGVTFQRSYWQIRPWVDADPPDRKRLGLDTALARQWADFLLDMKKISTIPGMPPAYGNRFTFAGYMPRLAAFTRREMPEFLDELTAILRRLQPFLDREPGMTAMFAHGDFHPGNILLKNGRIAGVIDWEFLGWKCAGYDLALLLGCLGMDNPEWLDGPAVRTLQDHLFRNSYMPEAAWEDLPLLMAAIRLGWFGEWVDLQDRPMARQELDYIRFLLG